MLDQLIAWDHQLFLMLNQWGTSPFDPFWLLMSKKGTNALVYLGLIVIYGTKKGLKPALYLLVVGAVTVGITDQITNLFKSGFMRLRPCYTPEIQMLMRLVKESCGGQYGFFSGHASNSFALAFFFGLIFNRLKYLMPLLLTLASLIAYSRIYLGVHFPLDVICGALAGILIASSVYFLSLRSKVLSITPY